MPIHALKSPIHLLKRLITIHYLLQRRNPIDYKYVFSKILINKSMIVLNIFT